ncbi:uncharacterized protein LOC131043319 isoform X1 [Cryptomeria japonica]|uniref:uncharacterized protein LOC131043319 isoform X1 n=1 Tax=Cryptomeria japonica TaxID=3369 RepID=UPI0027DA59E9|nr:uncharacterized protein LOC131043319 isoform X1 [Cryptomeria japonica]
MAERGRSRKPPEEPWDFSPIYTSSYHANQLLNCRPVDGWQCGGYIPEDRPLARSRENALLSARVYLQQDEAAEFRCSDDRRVSGSSSHGKRDFGRRLSYVQGEGYFTRDFQNQRNSRSCTDDIAQPPFSIFPARENSEKVDQPACFNGDDDDELEEGELIPSPPRSSSLTSSDPRLQTENEDELEEGQLAPSPRRENSCAADASLMSRKRLKRSRDFTSSQSKNGKKARERESHVIVLCGQGSQRQRQQNFQRNSNSNTHKDHEENDGRKAGLMLSCGLDTAFEKVGPELNATVAGRIYSNLDELGKFSNISAPRNVGNAALKEWKPLQKEGHLGKDKSIACGKDEQGVNNGGLSEMPGGSLQTYRVAHCSKVEDHCKQQHDFSAYNDVRSEVDLSSCLQQAPMAAQNFLCSNCENSKGFKENTGGCSGTDKEIENTEDMRNCKDCGSINKVDGTKGKMAGAITSVEANVCVADHLGVRSSGLPVKHVYPDIDVSFPSVASEDIVPFHKFISTIKECDLLRDDLAKKRELGRPCFTEATSVSSFVCMSTGVTNSTEFSDNHDINSEAKRVDFKTGTLASDSLVGNLNVPQIDKMRCITGPNAFRALRDNGLENEAQSCIKFSGTYPSDRFNFHDSSWKKLKSGHNPNLKINLTRGSSTSGSNFAVVMKHKWQNTALRSEVQHKLSASPSKNVHHNNEASHNFCQTQIPLKPSTSSLQIRPNIAGGLFNSIKPWTWTRSNNMIKPPVKAPNATCLMAKGPCIVTGSQTATYVLKGNTLLRAAEPTMSLHDTKRSVSGCLTTVQQYHVESSYTRNPSTTRNVAKTVPSTMTKVVSNLDMSKSSMESFLPPAASCIPYGTTLPVTCTGSATSLAEAMMTEISGETGVLHSRLSVSDAVDINYRDSQGKVYASVGCHVTSIPDSYILRARRTQSEDLMSNSKSGMIDHLKGKSNHTFSAPTCNSEDSIYFINECSQLQLASHGQDHHHERNSYEFFQRSKLTDQKTVTSLKVLKETSLPESLQKRTLKAQQNHTNFVTKLHRVLKQKKLATSLSLQGPTLNTGYPQSPRLTLFQRNKIVTSLLPWKRPVYVAAHSKRIKYVSKVRKGLVHILASRKLQCLQNKQAHYSRSVDGSSLHHSAASSLGGSSLKWNQFNDKHCEKDNEESTMSTAAVEKGKREDKDDVSQDVVVDAKEKTKKHVAYEGSSCNSDTLHTRCTTSTPRIFTSRRLSTSGFKYVKDGNGNQLVRFSNTISHALAGEKIRWSLHTVRSIMSKKQQYSQSLSRFGTSNKEVSICPGTNDSEKVAILTQFLKGTCSNMDCRLTHKVILESMADCSHFLLGVCTNESCPYRHVNVNPKAPICDGFLKGFCPDSDKGCLRAHKECH